MIRRTLALAVSAVLVFTTVGPAFADQPPVPPGYRPPADSDEAGLWMQSDEAERRIQTLPQLVRDEALNAYVKGLVCKLAGDYCRDIRVYILDVPMFNASMAPNGMLILYTGTLLRCDNEAQLAFVLAHEIAHFKKRHALDQWRNAINTSGAIAVLAVVSAGAGVFGLIGLMAELGAAAGFVSYSRDQEREADAVGFDIATAQDYDPHEAAALWTDLSAEDAADPAVRNRSTFLSSHPQSKERMQTMLAKADVLASTAKDWKTDPDDLNHATEPYRAQWYAEVMEFENSNALLTVLNRKIARAPHSGELQYFLAEAYRRRNEGGDIEKSRQAYQTAIDDGNGPVAAYKGLGIVAMKAGDKTAARSAFDQYLALSPQANDRAMIEYYCSRL